MPQWNCGCPGCVTARATETTRTQDCLAVSADGSAWYALNASPDLRAQLLATPELAPAAGTRDTPLRGVLLTSAELDHTLGLLTLREAAALTVHATLPVREALHSAFPVGPLLAPYTKARWHTVRPEEPFELDGALHVRAFALGSKRPRYAQDLPGAGREERTDWTVGYRLTDPAGGGVLVYAPCLAAWSEGFEQAIDGADLVVLDGTFLDDGEMAAGSNGQRTSRGMGHLAVGDSLPHLARHRGPRYLYTHLNNTNPLAHPDAPGHARLAAAGAEIAPEGGLIEL
ncbi:pyrroloquinoline quinone biosynthesis protein PqqB [Kitasatospora sp. NPDC050543]|uniref:pyrroloquinoline quinone biosynthesis protein PqqB n=1 Tax=Kitasatospora sp. NPDC050543 TaxID=3364054 RepID=UPI0037979DED